MARFLTALITSINDDNKTWTLQQDLVYESDIMIANSFIIKVPEGYETDFASVPRLPVAYLFTGNTAHRAAVVHDYLYTDGDCTKTEADSIFLEAMKATGVPAWRRYPMYLAVHLFGRGKFETKREEFTW